MKIIKKDFASPILSLNIWMIPVLSYLIQKVGGVEFNEYEWVWWAGIPTLVLIWLVINFKIKK
jgi:hypothetical protein